MKFREQGDLFGDGRPTVNNIKPWKPVPLAHDQWPPDYAAVYAWRLQTLEMLRNDATMLAHAKVYYKAHRAEFIMHWMDTYNPRKSGNKWVPFVFFWRQYHFAQFLDELDRDQENGLVEKSRDMGATWEACAYSVTCWLFTDDDATGWGSRKQQLVDTIGDPDSIFEKMRLLIRKLPDIWLPEGFSPRKHSTELKIINPANGSTITGEAGDAIGRGGRKSRYYKDESAHYERPEKIESALGDNTNVQIDISSVNGLGNVFHRRRESGIDWSPGCTIEPGFVRVFVFDWSDHPEKTQAWYNQRKAKAEREGMQHIFAQEVDRDYSAAIQNTIIKYEWVQASVDAHFKIPCLRVPPPEIYMAGLDVADDGPDRNALALRQWVILRAVEEWGARDTGVSARHMVTSLAKYKGIKVQWDSIGVGTGIKSEYNRLVDEKLITREQLQLISWNAGAGVLNPYDRIIPDDDESVMNKDFFGNMKAQAWWSVRTRFYKTWCCIQAIEKGEPVPNYTADELISLDGTMPLLFQLMKELAQPTLGEGAHLKSIINKKPEGTKSPNLADAVIQAFFPAQDMGGQAIVGAYSG